MRRRIAILTLWMVSISAGAVAQSAGGGEAQDPGTADQSLSWTVALATATYVFPDDDDYVQPTVTGDRGAMHLEARYNYEDRRSVSGFVGWNVAFGDTVALQMTPMLGAVVGQTNGIVPALELDLSLGHFAAYSEAELVIGFDRGNRFLYNWSEVSVWVAEWLRAGVVSQRTRVRQTPLDIQPGLLIGVAVSRFEPVFYFFNPGLRDQHFVASLGVEF